MKENISFSTTDREAIEVFRVTPTGSVVAVRACHLTPDRLAVACTAFLKWVAEQGEGADNG